MTFKHYLKNKKVLAVTLTIFLIFGIVLYKKHNTQQDNKNKIINQSDLTENKLFIVRQNDPESINRLFDRLEKLGADRHNLRFIDSKNSDAYKYARDDKDVYWVFINPRKIENADADSFAIWDQNGIIALDKTHVFITGDMVPEANPNTFDAVSSKYRNGPYYHDDKNVFYTEVVDNRNDYRYRLKKIVGADSKTIRSFQLPMSNIAVDDIHVYINGEVVVGIDGKTFTVTESSPYMYDKSGTYFFSINSGERPRLIFLDSSFEIRVFTNDSFSGGYVAIGDKMFFGTTTINGADPKTFYVFDAETQRGDDAHVKCIGLNNCPYAKDTSLVYYYGKKISGANPNNFTPIGYGLLRGMGKDPGSAQPRYASDGTHIYYQDKTVESADPKTFTPILSGGYFYEYGRDTQYVYWREKRIEFADPNTFKPVEGQQPYEGCGAGRYGIDASGVYYQNKLIPGADPKTFKAVIGGGAYGEDANRFYDEDKPANRSEFKECNYG